ncbi:hypothetical protein CANCADRAFT_98252 [Tortispora caseinolytica NRRL Y-17796]|uniref:Serine/threonine-protein kinase RIO2 n=1 Tax=Tortispora caseinolytica NRRL Y-17796 TaxID=767744 RepID=A0A1E4TDY9_9ASCO|nr:hypothetical protein CANCADRAFT_98252 [Tortispora caseinolytica NRRL Y-17796]
MKLDTRALRYLNDDDFRVLTAVEMGSKNHEVVPTKLILQIAGKRASQRAISDIAKPGLISKMRNAKYDGYRLTYAGYDYLALNAFIKRKTISAIGAQIGIGKESDIYLVGDPDGQSRVLKLHRLGRISFRTVKNNRDYLKSRKSASWMYLSRLAAEKEYTFMKALYDAGFHVPKPYDYSRHAVIMSLVDGYPMRQLQAHGDPAGLYAAMMDFIVKLACHGLIHCDFNEFNIMIRNGIDENDIPPEDQFIVIDFPQCVSINHPDAERYFDRDVTSIRRFFQSRLGFHSESYPRFTKDVVRKDDIDVRVEASGYSKKSVKEFEQAIASLREKTDADYEQEASYESENNDFSDSDNDDYDESDNGESENDEFENDKSENDKSANDESDAESTAFNESISNVIS